MLWRPLKIGYRQMISMVLFGMTIGMILIPQVPAQSEQVVVVAIKDFAFQTTQMPLQLHMPTVIHVANNDDIRHDFGSDIFRGTYTQVEAPGAITYGKDIGGVLVEPSGSLSIRFTIERPGRYEFRCSIHPKMKGEILLMSAGSV